MNKTFSDRFRKGASPIAIAEDMLELRLNETKLKKSYMSAIKELKDVTSKKNKR